MAYVNVKDWSVDQVMDWLKGLDPIILQYSTSFLNNGVTGHQLLNLRADDLEHLGVKVFGHQETILEAVEHLRHIHFELDKENLQMLALRVSCASNSLYRELLTQVDCGTLKNQVMADVHNVISTVKPLVCWLQRAPFTGDKDYIECKIELLQLCFNMAYCAHRGPFSEAPVKSIREICEKITKLADHIIQDFSDPMTLEPASLDLATFKKKEQEWGFHIIESHQPVHTIYEIKYGSPAHSNSKIEEGDEIVQINYQTVVGWQYKNVMLLLQNSPPEVVLTLKKRPRHTKVYGQIYMKPYRLPSKKLDAQSIYFRWPDNIQSPRLLQIPALKIPLPLVEEPSDADNELDSIISDDEDEPPFNPWDDCGRMYPAKPRPIVQRRNTISGATPTSKRSYPSIEQFWQLWKNKATFAHSSAMNIDKSNFDTDSCNIRDKSASCNLGLELAPRPTTVIGLSPARNHSNRNNSFKKDRDKNKVPSKKKVNFQEKIVKDELLPVSNLNEEKSVSVNSLASLTNESISFIDEGRDLTDRSSMVQNNEETSNQNQLAPPIPDNPTNESGSSTGSTNSSNRLTDSVLADVKILDIIKKFDEGQKPKIFPRSQVKKPPEVPQKPKKPEVPPRSATTKLRGRLDKSHSTPAYDLTGDNDTSDSSYSPATNSSGEAFSETKYELGIPIVEAVNLPLLLATSQVSLDKSTDLIGDCDEGEVVPPKPPPRTFGVVDLGKPAYPVDSPKPNLNDLVISRLEPKSTNVFEFPETSKSQSSVYGNKNFEPKLSSTPVKLNDSSSLYNKSNPSIPSFVDVQKSMSDSKISPTNSIVRAIYSSNKTTKAGRKKNNSIFAKRRKVSVNDLSPADNQGFLYQRLRSKHDQNVHWEKRWFVLLGNCLYGFRTREDPRASCLIFLSGFTVAEAEEVKSRANAFKVYHTGTAFYFSAENSEQLQVWFDLISVATLPNNESSKATDHSLCSETDEDEDAEKPKLTGNPLEKNGGDSLKKFGSLKKFAASKNGGAGSPSGSTSLDRKWFFNKSSSHSKHSLPVPTSQFRSYRKIRNNDPPPPTPSCLSSVTTGNFTSHVALFAPPPMTSAEMGKHHHNNQNVSVPNLTVELPSEVVAKNPGVLIKSKPLNYIHASNPSLCKVDFNVPTFPQKSFKPSTKDNSIAFMTLKELMERQCEEEKLNPFNMIEQERNLHLIKPDVVYGEIPIRPKEKLNTEPELISDKDKTESTSSSCFGKRLGSIKKSNHTQSDIKDGERMSTYPKTRTFDHKSNRSLPRTAKLQENYSPHYNSSRDLSSSTTSFKERSYEMIHCPETTTNDVHFAQNRNLDTAPSKSNKIKKQSSFTGSDKVNRGKFTNKIGDSSNILHKGKLKSATQYTPMSLPLGGSDYQKQKPKLAFELNLDDKVGNNNKGGKLKQIFGSNNIGKQEGGKKEKTFLGSPKLHRAIFGKNQTHHQHQQQQQVGDSTWVSNTSPPTSLSESTYSLEGSNKSESVSMTISPHADYPGLEYPPVFEAETYSLSDPQSSLTLLRNKQSKN